jgi:ABC-2 type transport system permease protein
MISLPSLTYTRYELVRMFRNKRFFIFSLVFPLALYLLVTGPNKHQHIEQVPFPLYYMTGMVAWGTMAAVIAGGARIAAERAVGWNRQLRLTPLPVRTYFATKVLTGYVMAAASIALLYAAGSSMGVHLSAGSWVTMTALILVGLIPFAVIGVLIGHLVTVDTMGPAMGGITSLLALLGGAWGPIGQHGWLKQLVELLPSHWLVQAGKSVMGGGSWPVKAWIVVAVWTVVLAAITRRVYELDTARV